MAKPFVKWAGGKSWLVRDFLERAPIGIRTYIEPFAGGAALYFALATQALEGARPAFKAVLADQNGDLTACYRVLKSDVDALVEALGAYRYDRDLFYETRARDTRGMSDVERAARLIFLNRTCFNGLWRVNSEGKFNVPFGRYKNPRILDEENLRDVAKALASTKAKVLTADFEVATQKAGPGDFVYFDPPYVPLTQTANFTDYVQGGFGLLDQDRLARELHRLRAAGANVMLSNADTPATRKLYKGFAIHVVKVGRSINSDPTKRGESGELVVTTWEKPGIYKDGDRVRAS